MSITVSVTGVVLDPLTVEVLVTHSGGLQRTFVATRPEAYPYRHTGTRPITDAELAVWNAATTRAQKRAAVKAIIDARIPEERPRLMAAVDAPPSPASVAPEDLPPSFTIADT